MLVTDFDKFLLRKPV